VDIADGSLYTSSTFWAIIGVAVAIVVGIVGVWAALRAASPEQRLFYSMPVITPLLNQQSGLPQDIEVRRMSQDGQGEVLNHPHVVNVQLTSRGRHDISREAFDGKEPLGLDVGAPIVECLKVATSPPDRSDPVWEVRGSKLLVRPSLIGRRQTTIFSLLVDGPSPCVNKPQQTLTDVRLVPGIPGSGFTTWQRVALVLVAVMSVIVVITLVTGVHSVAFALAIAGIVTLLAVIANILVIIGGNRDRWPHY
jgi:hypothetical protein